MWAWAWEVVIIIIIPSITPLLLNNYQCRTNRRDFVEREITNVAILRSDNRENRQPTLLRSDVLYIL